MRIAAAFRLVIATVLVSAAAVQFLSLPAIAQQSPPLNAELATVSPPKGARVDPRHAMLALPRSNVNPPKQNPSLPPASDANAPKMMPISPMR
jgi:hypothetical protein